MTAIASVQSRGSRAGLFLWAIVALLLTLLSSSASAQDDIYPTVLYSGVNPITVRSSAGISSIDIRTRDGWRPLVIGRKTREYRVMTTPIFTHCARQATFNVFVERIDLAFAISIRVNNCDGSSDRYSLSLENTWRLFHEDFGTVTLDDRPCHTFIVQSDGGDFIVDGVNSTSRQFSVRFPFRSPPIFINGRQTYRYSVCFTPRRLGRMKVPIEVLIRRSQPVGEYTTYVVADTAYVNVIEPPIRRPIPEPPIIIEPPPRPDPPALPPSGPAPPPKPPARVSAAVAVAPESLHEFVSAAEPTGLPTPDEPDVPEFVYDPTTFRAILSPSARTLEKGKGYVGSYDIAGILAGYGLTDRLTVIGGGLYVPSAFEEIVAVTGGAKYGLVAHDDLRIAAGVQINYSTSEESSIVAAAPYATANYGNVDRSVGLTVGYSWRRHSPSDTTIAPFSKQAALVGITGELRVARHWKIASEAFVIQESEFQPLAVTLRYFDDRYALEAGIATNLTPDNGLVLLPVITGIWTW